MTVSDGRRCSTANAYLRPAMKRANLAVRTEAHATRILFDGARAIGISYVQGGTAREVRARREVIVSAGSINTPQLLKLSGIGPAAELREHGIPVIRDLPGVGENLQDHLEFYFQVACTQPVTLYSSMSLWSRALIGARWLAFKGGLGATNHFETGGFIRSRAGVPYPDIQFHFLPLAVTYDGSSLAKEHGFQAHVGPMRSKSRGHVRIASADPLDKPKIRFNYLTHPDDLVEMRACVRLTREIFAQPAFDAYRGREMQPGADVMADVADRRIRARQGRERLSPFLHLQDGFARRLDGSRGPGGARDWRRGPARRGLVDHAIDHDRQPQRADHHAGREGRGSHPRKASPAASRGTLVRRTGLAGVSALVVPLNQSLVLSFGSITSILAPIIRYTVTNARLSRTI